MSDIIHLLPDSIANQIAAGEVVQRPASVVKELLENSLDAGATSIQLIIKDAGRTLIQVIDNGKGMSATDARMAFERHATSKIHTAEDLFALRTMGFRGEALASIAAIAHVELRTRQAEEEVGTSISIEGSKTIGQECVACTVGSNILVKNLFFNVPARRKFLKSNETEKRHILTEFERIAFVNPEREFTFIDNEEEVLVLPPANLKQRIINLIGKKFAQQLIPIEIETPMVNISGFVGKPESARKLKSLQYFFVNGRYMRHPYFGKAVQQAFEQLIPKGESPNFFIYLQAAPDTIDVNIHPTKTEIKFENERAIWQTIFATVREALGRSNEVPTIDFDRSDAIEIPIYNPSANTPPPQINLNPDYNPFRSTGSSTAGSSSYHTNKRPDFDWETLYRGFEGKADSVQPETTDDTQPTIFAGTVAANEGGTINDHSAQYYQFKNRYILTSIKSGMMLIDQHRAHIRILYEGFLNNIRQNLGVSQRVLFPEMVEFSPSEAAMIPYLTDDLEAIGFDLGHLGGHTYSVNGIPSEVSHMNPILLLHEMVGKSIETGSDVKDEIQETIALSMAQAAAINYGQRLQQEEMTDLVDRLFASSVHKHTPDGRTILATLSDEDLEKLFK